MTQGIQPALTISVIDSHTGGEPTRVITDGFPALSGASVADKRADLLANHLALARLIVDEPRGNEAMVAALLCEPADPRSATGVIFFDRTSALGMCGHGTIGVVTTLGFMGRIESGEISIETPVGVVAAVVNPDGSVTINNVPSTRLATGVQLDVPGVGELVGDVAYGGNTFFLVTSRGFDLERPKRTLLAEADAIRLAAVGAGYVDVDHVEMFGEPTHPDSNSRSFVLCPSGTYDRSPCGTGTSAKLACLAADGKLEEGDVWIQESITGSQFSARFVWEDQGEGIIVPEITGSATVVARGELLIGPDEYA